jgi:hypothetical protein
MDMPQARESAALGYVQLMAGESPDSLRKPVYADRALHEEKLEDDAPKARPRKKAQYKRRDMTAESLSS